MSLEKDVRGNEECWKGGAMRGSFGGNARTAGSLKSLTPEKRNLFCNIYREVEGMKWKGIIILSLVLGICLFVYIASSQAQEPSRKLTLLYTNNVNAEIDPCPV